MNELRIEECVWLNDHALEYAVDYGLTEDAVVTAMARPLRAFGFYRRGVRQLDTVVVMIGMDIYYVVVKTARDEDGLYTEVVTVMDESNGKRNETGVSSERPFAIDLV